MIMEFQDGQKVWLIGNTDNHHYIEIPQEVEIRWKDSESAYEVYGTNQYGTYISQTVLTKDLSIDPPK